MNRIMISHSSANNEAAREMLGWLAANGWDDVFLDLDPERGIAAGDRWQETLRQAVNTCEAAIFLVSPAWLASKWCLAEYLFTKNLGKSCFPVIIEPVAWDDLPVEMAAEHQIVDLVSDADAETRLKLGLEKAGIAAISFPYPEGRRPYPGLEPLTEDDPAVFFGRDAEILRALDRLRKMAETRTEKLLVILGPSGAGKSSLLRAGLWPRLARDSHNFLPLATIRPVAAALSGSSGLWTALELAMAGDAVAAHLAAETPRTRGAIRQRVEANPRTLLGLLGELRNAAAKAAFLDGTQPKLVIPIDQGEELFNAEGRAESERFLEILGATLRDDPDTLAVIAIRSDSYPHLQAEPRIRPELHAPFNLGPMGPEGFKEVIEGPAEIVRLEIEPTLTAALIRDAEGADALPLLAFTLERLYRDYGSDGDLQLAEYDSMKGISGAISAAVDDALDDPPRELPADRAALERLMRKAFIPHLVRVNAAGEFARRVARRDQLPAETRPLVDLLVEHRLLLADRRRTRDGEIEVIEIAHEALLRKWPLVVGWLEEEREFLTWRERIARTRIAYQQGDRGLLGERELVIASGWLRTRAGDLAEADRVLIEESQAAEAARLLRERRRSRAIMISSTIAAIVFLIGALVAVAQWKSAAKLRDAAQDARDQAQETASRLAKVNEQLRASRPLRVAMSDAPMTEVGASWFSVANTFARATVRVLKRDAGRTVQATGVLMRASALRPDWPDQPVLVTAAHILGREGSRFGVPLEAVEVAIPALDENVRYRLGRILWASEHIYGATVATVVSELPEDAVLVTRVADASYFSSLARAGAPEPADRPRIALSYAYMQGDLAFLASRILGRQALNGRQGIAYYQASEGGASGAPVFDSETGDLIGLHMAASPARAYCTWIGDLLNEMRAD